MGLVSQPKQALFRVGRNQTSIIKVHRQSKIANKINPQMIELEQSKQVIQPCFIIGQSFKMYDCITRAL